MNKLLVKYDGSCSMAAVYLNDKMVMMGNTWDFHPNCHGIHQYGNFKGPLSLAQAIVKTLGEGEVEKDFSSKWESW